MRKFYEPIRKSTDAAKIATHVASGKLSHKKDDGGTAPESVKSLSVCKVSYSKLISIRPRKKSRFELGQWDRRHSHVKTHGASGVMNAVIGCFLRLQETAPPDAQPTFPKCADRAEVVNRVRQFGT